MPCPPPHSGLSNDCSRSRLAVKEKSERSRLLRLVLMVAASAGGMIDPLWHESVRRTFHLPLIFRPIDSPSASIGYPVAGILFVSMSYGARYALPLWTKPWPAK